GREGLRPRVGARRRGGGARWVAPGHGARVEHRPLGARHRLGRLVADHRLRRGGRGAPGARRRLPRHLPAPGQEASRRASGRMTDVTLAERLRALYPQASRRSLKQWLESGPVQVSGRVARDGRAVVRAHDRVELGGRGRIPFPRGLGLVYEDEAIVVVDKPARLLTMATERERERTVYRLLWDYLAAQRPRTRP